MKLATDSFRLACGAEAVFDHTSGCAHVCTTCLCVVGSVSMPERCRKLEDEAREKERGTKKVG